MAKRHLFSRHPYQSQSPLDDHAAATEQPVDIQSDTTSCQLDIQFWYRRVFALCQSRLISRTDAEDATQEAFVRSLASVSELRSSAAMGAWLRQIAHNVCIDMIRRQKVRQTSSTDVENVVSDAAPESAIQKEQREKVIGLIAALPESLREIILLHYYEEMTYDEMAQWLSVARSTVNERLSKARHLLKQQLVSTENAP